MAESSLAPRSKLHLKRGNLQPQCAAHFRRRRANTFSLAATAKISALKGCQLSLFRSVWVLWASGRLGSVEPFYGFFLGGFVHFLKQVSSYFSGFGEPFATVLLAKLQQCFVDYETSPDFPLAWGGNDSIFIFGWTYPSTSDVMQHIWSTALPIHPVKASSTSKTVKMFCWNGETNPVLAKTLKIPSLFSSTRIKRKVCCKIRGGHT